MAGRKSTADGLQDRIEFVRSMLIRGYPKHSIKVAVRKKYGELSARQCEEYLSRAREILTENLGGGVGAKRRFRENALAFYEAVLADKTVPARDKIKAQERIDKLLGLEDKSNTPPLEIILGSLPPRIADAVRGLLSERVGAGQHPGQPGTNGHAGG